MPSRSRRALVLLGLALLTACGAAGVPAPVDPQGPAASDAGVQPAGEDAGAPPAEEASVTHACANSEECPADEMCTGTPEGRRCAVPPPFVRSTMASGTESASPPLGPQFPMPVRRDAPRSVR